MGYLKYNLLNKFQEDSSADIMGGSLDIEVLPTLELY